MNFLIDECLHASLVEVAVERGHEATNVTYRGFRGVQDWNLMAPIWPGPGERLALLRRLAGQRTASRPDHASNAVSR